MGCNVDDILAHDKDQEEHEERLEVFPMRLLEGGLTLNLAKCKLSTKHVMFL